MLKRAATSRAARNWFQSRVWISRRRDRPTLQSCNRVALVVVRAITFLPQDVPVFAGTYRACSRRDGSPCPTIGGRPVDRGLDTGSGARGNRVGAPASSSAGALHQLEVSGRGTQVVVALVADSPLESAVEVVKGSPGRVFVDLPNVSPLVARVTEVGRGVVSRVRVGLHHSEPPLRALSLISRDRPSHASSAEQMTGSSVSCSTTQGPATATRANTGLPTESPRYPSSSHYLPVGLLTPHWPRGGRAWPQRSDALLRLRRCKRRMRCW